MSMFFVASIADNWLLI